MNGLVALKFVLTLAFICYVIVAVILISVTVYNHVTNFKEEGEEIEEDDDSLFGVCGGSLNGEHYDNFNGQ